ncbi:unnamed protein product [Ectocarpus sp. 6 AP-2014]
MKTFEVEKPLMEEARYMQNPMVKLYPANSGSLNLLNIQKRKMGAIVKGILQNKYDDMDNLYHKGKLYAVLKDGEIAVAPDAVVSEAARLPDDMSFSTYIKLAKEMCLRMEENVAQGISRKKWSHWFEGGRPEPKRRSTEPSRRSERAGKRRRREAASRGPEPDIGRGGAASGGGVFGFDASDFESE